MFRNKCNISECVFKNEYSWIFRSWNDWFVFRVMSKLKSCFLYVFHYISVCLHLLAIRLFICLRYFSVFRFPFFFSFFPFCLLFLRLLLLLLLLFDNHLDILRPPIAPTTLTRIFLQFVSFSLENWTRQVFQWDFPPFLQYSTCLAIYFAFLGNILPLDLTFQAFRMCWKCFSSTLFSFFLYSLPFSLLFFKCFFFISLSFCFFFYFIITFTSTVAGCCSLLLLLLFLYTHIHMIKHHLYIRKYANYYYMFVFLPYGFPHRFVFLSVFT